LQAGERFFDGGGSCATSRKYNFDRHWRNLRTIFSHNPLHHKAKVIGDYVGRWIPFHNEQRSAELSIPLFSKGPHTFQGVGRGFTHRRGEFMRKLGLP
jgi:hypothetical protein